MEMTFIYQIFQVIILVLSAAVHEYMHGWMAHRLGDNTAQLAGRLTLNPLAHLEFFGSFLLPLVMIMTGTPFVFGWAKPVPYNPHNLRDKKYGEAKVALAGPMANLIIAIFFGLFLRFCPIFNNNFAILLWIITSINLVLMVFNLLPVPPLDGSKILAVFLPLKFRERYLSVERFGFVLVIIVVVMFGEWILPLVDFLSRIIVGS